jgi:hypothetical protein
MLSVKLQGGLGNQLFQLAFMDYISKITGKETYLQDINSPTTIHSKENYFDSIFKYWKIKFHPKDSYTFYENTKIDYEDWKTKLNVPANVSILGFFQRYEYTNLIRDEFIKKLSFNESILTKYPDISSKIFIHIRGGDFKNNHYHDICKKSYYIQAINFFSNKEFVIFTNDIPYAKEMFPNIPIIEESEIDSLYLMSKCGGCICANSSFSWWGAYLNLERQVVIPSRWITSWDHDGHKVPGWIAI